MRDFFQIDAKILEKKGIEQTKNEVRMDMEKSKKIIEETTNQEIKLCRMPHGFGRSWVRQIAKEIGYTLVNWTYGIDWKKMETGEMVEGYTSHIFPGAILLFHDGGRTRIKTVKILPEIIEAAKKKGFKFMKVSEILAE